MVNHVPANGLNIAIPHKKAIGDMKPDEMVAELNRLLNDDLTTESLRMSDLAVELESRYEAPIEDLLTPETKDKLQEMLKKVGSLRKEHPFNGSLRSLEISLHEMLKSQGGSGEAIELPSLHKRIVALLGGLFT